MDQTLAQSIVRTLAYFDIFDYPLTKEELYRFLYTESTGQWEYKDFLNILSQDDSFHMWSCSDGFYFLPRREKIIAQRQRRVAFLEQKMKIAHRGVQKIKWIPFVRAVFVCNTVASSSAQEDSDVDVFIVVKKNRLWFTRLLVTLTLSFFRLRRTKRRIANKICLSFYVADSHLNMSSLRIAHPDIYLVYWLAQLVPMYDPDDLYESIQRANAWAYVYVPYASMSYFLLDRYRVDDTAWSLRAKRFFAYFINDNMNAYAKYVQQRKMKRNIHSIGHLSDTRVVVNDAVLKFHENDRRQEYQEKWMEKCRVLGV
ncbi:MAG TPA: hypothetical protein DCS29_01460 [Candidatus Magasanikbacteria bacterium]|nr:MAG: hypothetical protein A2479_04335 [Candidatus Magasanikbacteria bacterium RIFOXYC2_FULL_39_8]HAT03428.1 hypothetical protein [Candidatus Magasanikbacteria bacterium]